LQSIHGVHTFRVESIAHGKAAPVDVLQAQGISDPDLLRKVCSQQRGCFFTLYYLSASKEDVIIIQNIAN